MATKEAHSKANIEYNRRQDNIMIRPSKEMGAKIREAAAAENMSVQGYVLQTLYARTGAKGGGVVENPESEPLATETASCLISQDREKILRDIVKDIVLNTPMQERDAIEAKISSIVRETVEENADKEYALIFRSLLWP